MMPYFVFSLLCLLCSIAVAGETFSNSIGMTFVKVGGSISQGGGNDVAAKKACNALFFENCGGSGSSDYPGAVDHAFWIGVTEVTQAQWQKVMGKNPSHFKGKDHPVEKVNYYEVEKFMAKLNQLDPNRQYRLPTEWEWEYAARAGAKTDYWWGSQEPVCHKGVRNGAKFDDDKSCDDTGTEPVKSYQANPFGLYDVSGNVWEWTCTLYERPYGEQCDASGQSAARVLRGGAWYYDRDALRLGYRSSYPPDNRINYIGFRVVSARLARIN